MRELPPLPVQNPEIPQNQVVAGPPKKPSPLEPLNRLKEKFSAVFARLTFISPRAKKVIAILLAFIVLSVLVLAFVPIIKKLLQKPVEEMPPVEPAQLTLTTRKPSRYATDEVVLKVETDVANLEKDLNSLEVKESDLNPPPLNWDVNFKE
jgi:hypothetical protein